MTTREGDDKRTGVAFMVLGVAALTFMDALGKGVAAGHSVFQMLAVRSTVALALIAPALVLTRRTSLLATGQPWGHLLRAGCGLLAFTTFYTSLRYLSLANAVAIAFGSPFMVTILAAVTLGERVGARRWLAIAFGFGGVLVLVRPTAETFQPAALLVILAGVAYASMMVLTRWMTAPGRPPESSVAFVFYMLLGQAAAGWLVAAPTWVAPEPKPLALMMAMGVLGVVGNYGLAEAFRKAPAAVVAPLEYTGLIWAVALGFALFGDVPTPSFWLASAVIVAAGVYAVRAE